VTGVWADEEQQHMANCFPADHKAHDPPPDVVALVTNTLDKLTRNTFAPALATQTTLLESVALDHAKPLPIAGPAARPVEMHLDTSKAGRARLNARKKALAGRKKGDVRVLGVDAESRGGVGLSEEIRNALDEEFSDGDGVRSRSGSGSGPELGVGMNVDPVSDEDVPLPPTQAFGQSNLQAKMQHRSGSRGLFDAEHPMANKPEQPFRAGEADRLDGSASRNVTIKTTEGTGDDRDLKRRTCPREEGSALASKFGLGRDHVRAGVEWGLAAPRRSLWEAASGV
jgi:hypothetical protein